MYEAFFGLNTDPFRLSSDPRFSFSHPSYRRAKASLQYALHRAEGFVMVTGLPGTGKTTLIHDLMAELSPDEFVVAYLSVARLEADDLLRMAAHAFGLSADGVKKAQVLVHLMDFLEQKYRHSFRALLIIDEAHDLSRAALEEVRLLNNLQYGGQPMLQIILLGQEGLRELLRRPEMELVHQRLIAAYHLEPLTAEETGDYVRHRLQIAGWKGDPVIEPGVLPIVHAFSEGVPRRINLICSRLFLHAFVAESHNITQADAEEVIRDLHGEELAQPLYQRSDLGPVAKGQVPQAAPDAAGAPHGRDFHAAPEEKAPDLVSWPQIDQGLYGVGGGGVDPPARQPAHVSPTTQRVAPEAPLPEAPLPEAPLPKATPPKAPPTKAPSRKTPLPEAPPPKAPPADVLPKEPVVAATSKSTRDADRKSVPTKPRVRGGEPEVDPPKVSPKAESASRPAPKVTVYTVPVSDRGARPAVKPVAKTRHAVRAKVDGPGVTRPEPGVDVRIDEDPADFSPDQRGTTGARGDKDPVPVPRITASPAMHIAAERDEMRRLREARTPLSRKRQGPRVSRRADRIGVVTVVSLFLVALAFAVYVYRSAPPETGAIELRSPAEVVPAPVVEPGTEHEAIEPPL